MLSPDAVALNVKGISDVFKNAASNDILRHKEIPIFNMKTGTTLSETFTSREGMSGVKELAENETPPSLAGMVGPSTTITKKTYGGAIEITREMRLQAGDSTVKVGEYVNDAAADLLQANRMKFLNVIYGMLNDGFTGATYLCPDTKALFANDHAWATGTTFSNKGTAALSLSAWEAVEKIGGAFVDGNGVYFPLTFDTIIVKMGSSAATTAKKLFAEKIVPTHVADVNIFQGYIIICRCRRISITIYLNTRSSNSGLCHKCSCLLNYLNIIRIELIFIILKINTKYFLLTVRRKYK
jgi:hypothetical protein